MHRYLLATVAALTLATATDASAQQRGGAGGSGNQLSIYGIASYYWTGTGLGLGARYELPIVPEGLLGSPSVRDDLSLDFGVDYLHESWGSVSNWDPYRGYYYTDLSFNAIIPTVGVLWNFRLTPKFTVYPKLDLGYAIMWWSSDVYYGNPHASALFLQGVAGATYKFDRLSLRAELGSGMLKLGVAIPM